MSDVIYAVTMLETMPDEPAPFGDVRCVGWFANERDAVCALTTNNADVSDGGLYRFAVIEEVRCGFYPCCKNRSFYEFDETNDSYVAMGDLPKWVSHVCSFGIG